MANSFFSSKKVYGEGWDLLSETTMSAEDKALVKSAEVVTSQYGLSVCFHMNAGGCVFTPVSRNTVDKTCAGEVVDLNKIKILTLGKQGSANIERIEW